ncbi:hypothetical protein DNTS_022324 [Danionella cerebrum]|uniref:SEFIR domain-containing protein n=1 Tax=Danionella cerebrum TaxID=2873325 RepID=A0A553N072_9TELE|nr:hypothetical protein DNTS_022324 [Danionella translucida]
MWGMPSSLKEEIECTSTHLNLPVLLVSSSCSSVHLATVSALASTLQLELGLDVRFAQWAQRNPSQATLSELGPVPWLHGQIRSVRAAGGTVLIIWSPEAQGLYKRWIKKGGKGGGHDGEHNDEDEQREGASWSSKFPAGFRTVLSHLWGLLWRTYVVEDVDVDGTSSTSSAVCAVFMAALSSLWSCVLEDRNRPGFGIVQVHNWQTIPKLLQCVRQYRLPQDCTPLIQDLILSSVSDLRKFESESNCLESESKSGACSCFGPGIQFKSGSCSRSASFSYGLIRKTLVISESRRFRKSLQQKLFYLLKTQQESKQRKNRKDVSERTKDPAADEHTALKSFGVN